MLFPSLPICHTFLLQSYVFKKSGFFGKNTQASRVMAKYPRMQNLTALIEHCLRETDVPGDDDDFIRELNPTFFSENSGAHHETSSGVNATDRSSVMFFFA